MSDSIRDAATAHNNDVARTLYRRGKLLEQLYATTVSWLGLKGLQINVDGIDSFLDANDLTKGLSFNPSTLPGANHPQYLESKAKYLNRDSGVPSGSIGDSRTRDQVSNAIVHGSDSADTLVQESIKPAIDGKSVPRIEQLAKEDERHDRHREPGQESGQVVGVVNPSSEGIDISKRTLGYPSDGRFNLSTKGVGLEEQSEEGHMVKGDGHQQTPTVQAKFQEDSSEFDPTQGGVSRPELRTHAQQADTKISTRESDIEGEARKGEVSHEAVATEVPSSSDEQIQLEKAESVHGTSHHHESHPSPDLPSRFLNGSLDDGEPMGGVSDLPNEQDSHSLTGGRHVINENDSSMKPTVGLRDGMNGEASRDLTFSRRPPMRIDTGIPPLSSSSAVASQNKPTLPNSGASQTPTPSKTSQAHSNAQSPPERMTTRVSSGALRHKSVSEILGETPRSAHTERANAEASQEDSAAPQTPKSASSVVSPDPAIFRQRLNEINQKEKSSKLSTVVFAKPQPASNPRISDVSEVLGSVVEETPIKDRNYLLTWLVTQVYTPSSTHPVDRKPLNTLLRQAHKTLSTSDIYVDFDERQYCRILVKVQELQVKGKWSLRQPVRCAEPIRAATHWDVILGQAKWMSTDFREERKWKAAGAKYLAEICAQWVISSPKERESLQIRLKVKQSIHEPQPSTPAPTPDLVHMGEDDDTEAVDEDLPEPGPSEAPAAIFSLPPDIFVFGLNRSPVSEKIMHELPLYEPNADAENGVLGVTEVSLDDSWKTPIVPVSKYSQGKIISCEEGPPRKKSRYSYSDENNSHMVSANDFSEHATVAPAPENNDIALFNPEHKHIRDRIHTGHAFRPPSEHLMPEQSFFECRQPSQWTMAEDDELRKLVREYAYNWSLISSCLTPSSIYSSGAERRTPWECFERWVALEGLPAEMSKVHFFRAYHNRLQQAQRVYEAQQQQLMQHHPTSPVYPTRRRSTVPYSVDRRKNNKHIHLIDAMRKLAKKRENKALKDQHISTAASLRKNNEPQKPRPIMHTPRELSRMKYENQVKREEQIRAHRIQYMQQQQQRASMVQRANAGQQPIQPPNSTQLPRNVVAGVPTGSSPNMKAMGQLRGGGGGGGGGGSAAPQMQRPVNGQPGGVMPANAHGVPHAPMQPHMQMQMGQRIPSQVGQNMLYAATQVQAEQQAQLQRQRHLQHSQLQAQAGSPNMQNHNVNSQNNPNMLGTMDGRSSPAVNGVQQQTPGNSTSPNIGQPQTLSSGLTPAVNQIQSQIKSRNPQASPDQIRALTTEQLFRMSQHAAAHQAMQVASGNANASAVAANGNISGLNSASPMQQQAMMTNAGSPMLNPQQYAQMMIEQQRKQQNQRSGSISNGTQAMNRDSRGATPINQPNGNTQGGRGMSQSPRQGQVGVVGGQ